MDGPSLEVRQAFGIENDPIPLAGGTSRSFLAGTVVFKHADDPVELEQCLASQERNDQPNEDGREEKEGEQVQIAEVLIEVAGRRVSPGHRIGMDQSSAKNQEDQADDTKGGKFSYLRETHHATSRTVDDTDPGGPASYLASPWAIHRRVARWS